MGILKIAAIAAVGIALLPSDREKQTELYGRAATAAKWTVTFCDRNADTCAQASTVWDLFLKKAEFGAKLAYDVIHDDNAVPEANGDDAAPALANARSANRSGTLNDTDLVPKWRGKVSDKKGI